MELSKVRLSQLPLPIKVLVSCFVMSLMFGYLMAVLQIYNRTEFDPTKTIHYYRGVESANELEATPPPSFGLLLSVAHVHTFSQPVMLALISLCFALSYAKDKAKIILIVLSFVSSFISNISPFLIRYLSGKFSILLPCSQMLLMLAFFIMSFVIIDDLWGKREESH